MWTHTWGILLLGGTVYLLLAQETGHLRLNPILLATVLSWTYFVRPTNSIFIVGVTIYILVVDRALFISYAVTGAAWFMGFVVYSWVHFGKLLPSYYQANRLETAHFWEALAGHLISPARGTLVYVPITLAVILLLARHWRRRSHLRLVWLALATGIGHLLTVSCFSPWFGGWCYGPRYTAEWVPWLVLLMVVGTKAALDWQEDDRVQHRAFEWKATWIISSCLLLVSMFTNERGANAIPTMRWNYVPEVIDDDPGRVWDWRYPQFLAGIIDMPPPAVFPDLHGHRVFFGNDAGRAYQWEGWSASEEKFCWTDGYNATLIFATSDTTENRLRVCFASYIHGRKLDRQRITIRLNGQQVAAFIIKQPKPCEYVFVLPAGALQRNNVLTFRLPDADSPESTGAGGDERILGIALYWMELVGATSPGEKPAT